MHAKRQADRQIDKQRQIQTDRDKYDQIQTDTNRWRQTKTNQDKPKQTDTTKKQIDKHTHTCIHAMQYHTVPYYARTKPNQTNPIHTIPYIHVYCFSFFVYFLYFSFQFTHT